MFSVTRLPEQQHPNQVKTDSTALTAASVLLAMRLVHTYSGKKRKEIISR
jgi:hypothetical protein